MSMTIKLRKGLDSQWASNDNIILASGEPGFELNTGRLKIGNGTSTWANLYYASIIPTGFLAGSGINIDLGTNGSTATIAHADTSSQDSVSNTNGNVIQSFELDTYGHVTSLNSIDLDGRYYTETEADNRFVNVDGDQTISGVKTFSNTFKAAYDTDNETYNVEFLSDKIQFGPDINVNLSSKTYYNTAGIFNDNSEIVNIEYLNYALSGIAYVKKLTESTNGYIPTWNGTSGDALNNGYSVETTLIGEDTALPRADAVKTYVDNLLAVNDAMVFKGTIGLGGTVESEPTTYSVGWTYRVITAGIYAGKVCEIGDLLIAIIDRTGSGNTNDDWTVVQTNIDGAVVGPASSVDNRVALFSGTSGKTIKDSSVLISDLVPTTRSLTINGTTNQLTVSNESQDLSQDRTWTLSLPQDIHTSATPTFNGLTANGTVNIRAASSNNAATQIPVFVADPSSTTKAVVTRTPVELLSDIGAYPASNPDGYLNQATLCDALSAASCVIDGGGVT